MNKEKRVGLVEGTSPLDRDLPIWRLERQIAEQLRRGVEVNGSVVAVSVGSSMFTYVRLIGNDLIVKYIEGCVVVTVSAKAVGEEVKVYNVAVHNICSAVDL